jgi:hypothetical protein
MRHCRNSCTGSVGFKFKKLGQLDVSGITAETSEGFVDAAICAGAQDVIDLAKDAESGWFPLSRSGARINTPTAEEGHHLATRVHAHVLHACCGCTRVCAEACGNTAGEGQEQGTWRVTCEPDELAAVGDALGIDLDAREHGGRQAISMAPRTTDGNVAL